MDVAFEAVADLRQEAEGAEDAGVTALDNAKEILFELIHCFEVFVFVFLHFLVNVDKVIQITVSFWYFVLEIEGQSQDPQQPQKRRLGPGSGHIGPGPSCLFRGCWGS